VLLGLGIAGGDDHYYRDRRASRVEYRGSDSCDACDHLAIGDDQAEAAGFLDGLPEAWTRFEVYDLGNVPIDVTEGATTPTTLTAIVVRLVWTTAGRPGSPSCLQRTTCPSARPGAKVSPGLPEVMTGGRANDRLVGQNMQDLGLWRPELPRGSVMREDRRRSSSGYRGVISPAVSGRRPPVPSS
jgi:hypothetical protein